MMNLTQIASKARKTADAHQYPYKPSNLIKIGLIVGACMALAAPRSKEPDVEKKPAMQSPELNFYFESDLAPVPPCIKTSWEELLLNIENWKNAPLEELLNESWKIESSTETEIKYGNINPIEFLGGPARIVRIRENQKTKTIESIEIIWTDLALVRKAGFELKIGIEKNLRKQKAMLRSLEGHNKSFSKVCLTAYEEIVEKLTTAYGRPDKGQIGEKINFTVPTLDFETKTGVTIRLIQENEKRLFAILVPTKRLLEQKSEILKPEFIDMKERERLALAKKNVQTLDNGDVIIKNVPMQDQGVRPVCGYAAMSMIMEYWGANIPYALGMVKKGTFSSTDNYRPNFAAAIDMARLRDENMKVDFRKIMKEIDEGKPLIVNRKSRGERTDLYMKWKEEAEKDKNFVIPIEDRKERRKAWANDDDPPHQSIITGYNKEKKVIILTDSWGNQNRGRRISLEEFKWISRDMTTYSPQ